MPVGEDADFTTHCPSARVQLLDLALKMSQCAGPEAIRDCVDSAHEQRVARSRAGAGERARKHVVRDSTACEVEKVIGVELRSEMHGVAGVRSDIRRVKNRVLGGVANLFSSADTLGQTPPAVTVTPTAPPLLPSAHGAAASNP